MKNWLVPNLLRFFGIFPLSALRAFGSMVGWLMWRMNGRSAKITTENLRLCFPDLSEAQRRELARRSLVETAKVGAEAAAIWCKPREWLMGHISEIVGLDVLQKKLAEGRGLVILAPHLGNWEVVSIFVAEYAPLTALYQPPSLPGLDKLILEGRSKSNISMAPTNRRGVMQLFKALQRGEMVGILPDQVPDAGNGAEVAPFFGVPALTMTLVHSLVERTGCAVISIYAERVESGFRMVMQETEPGIGDADIQRSVTALNASVEACVRSAPAQYQWEYKRFRRLPEGYPRYYKKPSKQ